MHTQWALLGTNLSSISLSVPPHLQHAVSCLGLQHLFILLPDLAFIDLTKTVA